MNLPTPAIGIRALKLLVPLTLLLLGVQYLLGLWTSAYAPSAFTSSTSLPSLSWHVGIGIVVFLVALIGLIAAALSRNLRLIAPSLIAVVAIYLAGYFGRAFISSTPNDPLDSFLMGFMFLVAFLCTIGMGGAVWRVSLRSATSPTSDRPSEATV